MGTGRSRFAAFALACFALLVAAISFEGGGEAVSPSGRTEAQPVAPVARSRPATEINPRPFLRAFLRYELGERDPALHRRLRATTTRAFGAQLLSSPARAPKPPLPPARIAHLRIRRLSNEPARALVSGTALRTGASEQFAFLFEARRGVWLAAGPAE